MKIVRAIGREVFDSRGWPTIQCELLLDDGTVVFGTAPAGISKGSYEARELRDGGKRFEGRGVHKAVETIESVLAPEIVGQEPQALEFDFKMIEMDGTAHKGNLGANTMLAVSMAMYRAQARDEGIELFELIAYIFGSDSVTLPFPLFNVINGGLHAHNNLVIQEYLVMPIGLTNFREAMDVGGVFVRELRQAIEKSGKRIAFGDEGGFSVDFKDDMEALEILTSVIERMASENEKTCVIGLDVAASRLFDEKTKKYNWGQEAYTTEQMIALYEKLCSDYPIYSIEDGLGEDDWDGWHTLTELLREKVQIVGDDIFVTNPFRIGRGIEENVATAAIIKPNQIGTVSETLQAMRLCRTQGLNMIVSHRSGDTEDSFIADLAVGTSAGQIKTGGFSRSERMAKYNRLLAIEDKLMLSLMDA